MDHDNYEDDNENSKYWKVAKAAAALIVVFKTYTVLPCTIKSKLWDA
jgi:hypothetical protein